MLHEQAFGFGRQRLQQVFETAQVIRGLCQRARQLLDVGVPVQFQRIEVACHERVLVAVHDLCFGLDFEFTQLLAKPADRLLQFLDMKLERADLLRES